MQTFLVQLGFSQCIQRNVLCNDCTSAVDRYNPLKSHWRQRDENNDGILRMKDKKFLTPQDNDGILMMKDKQFLTPQDGYCNEAQAWRRAVRGLVRGDLEEIQRHHRRQDAQGKLDIEQDAEQWAKEGLTNYNCRTTLETMPLAVILNNLALRTVHNINYQLHRLDFFDHWEHSVNGEAKGKRRGRLSFEMSIECGVGRRKCRRSWQ